MCLHDSTMLSQLSNKNSTGCTDYALSAQRLLFFSLVVAAIAVMHACYLTEAFLKYLRVP